MTGSEGERYDSGPAASPPLPATDVTDKALQAFIAAMPKDAITDSPIRTVDVGGSRIGIYDVFRPKSMPGDAISHTTRTSEVYYMLEGSGTLVTGGSIADPKPPPSGPGSGPRGERIEAGVSRRVTKGDIIVIPGRTRIGGAASIATLSTSSSARIQTTGCH